MLNIEPFCDLIDLSSPNVKNMYKKSDYEGLEECGVDFKYMQVMQEGEWATVRSFLKNIEPISCENLTKLFTYETKTSNSSTLVNGQNSFTLVNGLDINLSPDEVDVAHVGLAGAVAILIFSKIICYLCCLCRKKKSNGVSIPMA